ncbi:hypothetical protein IMZ68_04070 [Candidatus Bathyarchaeota archaeon]|nr:hypothetical protein [Candidatus Bathyarchaeota archaeon]
MIQIEDWVVIAGILAFFVLFISYLIYFRITRKLFPLVMEFQKEINPDKAITVLSIEGSGIIKKIAMQVTENDNSWINMIIDGATHSSFVIAREPNNLGKTSYNEPKDKLLKLEAELDTKFHKDFMILIHNRSNESINSNGKVFYEIKRPLKIVLKTIYSETTS